MVEPVMNLPAARAWGARQIEAEVQALALRHRAAAGPGMRLMHMIGGEAEALLNRLPQPVRQALGAATGHALGHAFDLGLASRRRLADRSDRGNALLAAMVGAAGGLGGLPTALAELPLTVTMLLRAMQGIAAEHGFDPSAPEVRADCLRLFATAGPLSRDDGAETGFLAARMVIAGQGLQSLAAKVAPRLAPVLGQKLALQAAPVIGAVAGAAVNYIYTGFYQDMARVEFGLSRLAVRSGARRETLARELAARIGASA